MQDGFDDVSPPKRLEHSVISIETGIRRQPKSCASELFRWAFGALLKLLFCRAHLRDGHGGGQHLRIGEAMDDRGLAGGHTTFEGCGKFIGAFHPFSMSAEGTGISGKIRIFER